MFSMKVLKGILSLFDRHWFDPQLMAWPERSPEEVTVVTITPDYHGTRHLGYISALKKFTWYLTSVLCFTTPGNGPRSVPKLVQTHEDSE